MFDVRFLSVHIHAALSTPLSVHWDCIISGPKSNRSVSALLDTHSFFGETHTAKRPSECACACRWVSGLAFIMIAVSCTDVEQQFNSLFNIQITFLHLSIATQFDSKKMQIVNHWHSPGDIQDTKTFTLRICKYWSNSYHFVGTAPKRCQPSTRIRIKYWHLSRKLSLETAISTGVSWIFMLQRFAALCSPTVDSTFFKYTH